MNMDSTIAESVNVRSTILVFFHTNRRCQYLPVASL